ncbi:MAG: polyphosphate kinase 2 family protein [Hyphomicrobiales bacterium]
MSQPLVPPPGEPVDLAQFDPGFTGGLKKGDATDDIEALRVRLNDLQDLLYAAKSHAVLVVLQGIDTAGKDGTIKSVFEAVGPLGCSVVSFGVPTEEELAHDYLWRYHLNTPRRGRITIFNRSHYEAVLVERVKQIVPPEVWQRRYDEINRFEEYLTVQGTVILKFFLHISKDEQRERLQERIDNPRKHWKFRRADLDERLLWDDYQAAFQDMLTRCNTPFAPWHIVPADHKWYRDVVVARAIIERLESLDLKYPPAEEGITDLRVV